MALLPFDTQIASLARQPGAQKSGNRQNAVDNNHGTGTCVHAYSLLTAIEALATRAPWPCGNLVYDEWVINSEPRTAQQPRASLAQFFHLLTAPRCAPAVTITWFASLARLRMRFGAPSIGPVRQVIAVQVST